MIGNEIIDCVYFNSQHISLVIRAYDFSLYATEGRHDYNKVCSWEPSLAQFYVQPRSRMSRPSVVQLHVWVKSGIVGIITRSSLLQHIEKQS